MTDVPRSDCFMPIQTSPTIAKLVGALAQFQGSVKAPTKDARGEVAAGRPYAYLSLPELLEAVREPLAKAGIVVLQFPIGDLEPTHLATWLEHTSGEYIRHVMPFGIVISDNGDAPQGAAAGSEQRAASRWMQTAGTRITYIRRYALLSVLALCGVDDDDDAQKGNKGRAPAPPPPRPTPTPQQVAAAVPKTKTGLEVAKERMLAHVRDHICQPSGMDAATLIQTVCQAELGRPRITTDEELARVAACIEAGLFDPITGERLEPKGD